ATPFAAAVAVGARVEGLAAAVGRERLDAAQAEHDRRRGQHVDAADERALAVSRAQALTGELQRDQRRAARGVDDEARAVDAEEIGDAVRRDAHRRTGERVEVDLFGSARAGRVPRTAVE